MKDGPRIIAEAKRDVAGAKRGTLAFVFAGERWLADPRGVLYRPSRRALLVSDLHLEKGSFFAGRGALLPPYDTRATLACLASAVRCYDPVTVVALGDSFHDCGGADRLDAEDLSQLRSLMRGRDWLWVLGNHDPEVPAALGGDRVDELTSDGIVLRHQAAAGETEPELSGHYHPKARIAAGGRRLSRPCFALTECRLILPAMGAFTGGLNVCDPALAPFLGPRFHALVLGRRQVSAVAASRLC